MRINVFIVDPPVTYHLMLVELLDVGVCECSCISIECLIRIRTPSQRDRNRENERDTPIYRQSSFANTHTQIGVHEYWTRSRTCQWNTCSIQSKRHIASLHILHSPWIQIEMVELCICERLKWLRSEHLSKCQNLSCRGALISLSEFWAHIPFSLPIDMMCRHYLCCPHLHRCRPMDSMQTIYYLSAGIFPFRRSFNASRNLLGALGSTCVLFLSICVSFNAGTRTIHLIRQNTKRIVAHTQTT